MGFVKTLDLLNAAKARLEALTVSGEDPTRLFTEVKVYAREDLVAALSELYLYDDRLAILIPGGWRHRNVKHGVGLRVRRHTEFMVLLTDRNYGGENTALVGEAGENPGVLELAERVLADLTGQTLGKEADWVALEPGSGEVLRLSDKEREDAPARDAWSQDFGTDAGEVLANIKRLHVEGEEQ